MPSGEPWPEFLLVLGPCLGLAVADPGGDIAAGAGTAPMKVPMMEERISVGKIRFRSALEGKTCSILTLFFSAL